MGEIKIQSIPRSWHYFYLELDLKAAHWGYLYISWKVDFNIACQLYIMVSIEKSTPCNDTRRYQNLQISVAGAVYRPTFANVTRDGSVCIFCHNKRTADIKAAHVFGIFRANGVPEETWFPSAARSYWPATEVESAMMSSMRFSAVWGTKKWRWYNSWSHYHRGKHNSTQSFRERDCIEFKERIIERQKLRSKWFHRCKSLFGLVDHCHSKSFVENAISKSSRLSKLTNPAGSGRNMWVKEVAPFEEECVNQKTRWVYEVLPPFKLQGFMSS